MTQYVYYFGGGKADGSAALKDMLGGKGSNLAEMSRRGFPVPAGFTVTTEVCRHFFDHEHQYPDLLQQQIQHALRQVEQETGKVFGDPQNPLLMAVRSGARESMPGMMDTVLNLGLNDVTVEGLKTLTGDGRFAYDCYRRLIQMYGDVVMGVQKGEECEEDPFEAIIDNVKSIAGVTEDVDLNEAHLRQVIFGFLALIKKKSGKEFQDPFAQLDGAIGAVFQSWMNQRAIYIQSIIFPRIGALPSMCSPYIW